MDLLLDPASPDPVYHQIAESLRYRIASGLIRPGQRLPSVRDAACRWNVHFHTVRRAYRRLADQGLVDIAGARGVRVCSWAGAQRPDLQKFIHRIRREAARRFGLSAPDLARCVLSGSSATLRPGPVYVLECSATQCQDLADQIRAQFGVDAAPWALSGRDPLPAGELVATLFHFSDLRRRCPQRLSAIHFLSIHLDPALPARLERAGGSLRVCDPDPEMRRNIAADLSGLFAHARRGPRIELGDGRALASKPGWLHVVSPRLWGALTDAERRRHDIVEARYVFNQRELLDLGARLGWPPAPAQKGAA